MLTTEETVNLIEQAKQGSDLAKEKLITINSPLIKSIVKRYLNKGVDYEDLYQLGALGFVKAINNYDSSFNVKFTTYAVPMIAGEIKRFLRDDGSIKVSRSIKHFSTQIKNYILEFSASNNKNPTIEQIAEKFNIEQIDVILALEANSSPISLNEKIKGESESITVLDKISDNFSCESYLNKITIKDMISKLNAREKQVIVMRYYLDKTQSEIAKELGVSQVQVSRIENKVLNEFRDGIDV